MRNRRHHNPIPEDNAEDKPFCMTVLDPTGLADIPEMADSLQILSPGRFRVPSPRSRFFSGICLALPLSALLWWLTFYLLHYIAS
jgi:hypothetical protein